MTTHVDRDSYDSQPELTNELFDEDGNPHRRNEDAARAVYSELRRAKQLVPTWSSVKVMREATNDTGLYWEEFGGWTDRDVYLALRYWREANQ